QNFTLLEHDINIPLDAKNFEKIDQIYNLACPASPNIYQRDPVQTTITNVLGVINMLEFAKTLGARILQASTSEVYGNPEVHPQTENYFGNVNILGPRACYDEGKRCAETLFMDYYRQHNLDIKIVRIFNTYGSYMYKNDGRVVSNFIVQALQGEEITIFGDGSQTRSFQYIDDLIDGLIKMMACDDFIGPVNLGNPNEITVEELAYSVIRLTDSRSKIVYMNLPKDDPIRRNPDIALAREKLYWSPKINLEEGLARTIEYFKLILKSH
ncbi:GDP-mannose 4,6-dehydratase, partial [Patescibacteria group bacterium]|nr:GDP-mannose 4,6-dehydratase [Patescibacteria group bacterium]